MRRTCRAKYYSPIATWEYSQLCKKLGIHQCIHHNPWYISTHCLVTAYFMRCHVFLDIRFLSECSSAHNTLIWFFPCVGADVLLQIKVLHKHLLAVLTFQLLLAVAYIVDRHVHHVLRSALLDDTGRHVRNDSDHAVLTSLRLLT